MRSENQVSKCTPMRARSSSELAHDVAVAPLARLLLGDVVTELGAHPRRHVDEVRALVAVFGRLATRVAGQQRSSERVELAPGVVEVVLAVHLGALGREQVREGVADRDPPSPAGVQADRSGWRRRTRG